MPGIAISDDNWEDFEPVEASCENENLIVKLANGMVISTPLWWYPALQAAPHDSLRRIEYSPSGIHFPDLDEDYSIIGMLSGLRSPGAKPPAEAAE